MSWQEFENWSAQLDLAVEHEWVRVHLIAAEWTSETLSLTLTLNGHDELDSPVDERWTLEIHDVQQHELSLGDLGYLPDWQQEHPRLLAARTSWAALYYAQAPQRPAELLSDLFRVHDRLLYGPMGTYGPYGDPTLGYGLLAQGPEALINAYAQVLAGQGMRPSLLPSVNPAWSWSTRQPVEGLRLLNLSGGQEWATGNFVIGTHIVARRETRLEERTDTTPVS